MKMISNAYWRDLVVEIIKIDEPLTFRVIHQKLPVVDRSHFQRLLSGGILKKIEHYDNGGSICVVTPEAKTQIQIYQKLSPEQIEKNRIKSLMNYRRRKLKLVLSDGVI